jgi:hypothetical protein
MEEIISAEDMKIIEIFNSYKKMKNKVRRKKLRILKMRTKNKPRFFSVKRKQISNKKMKIQKRLIMKKEINPFPLPIEQICTNEVAFSNVAPKLLIKHQFTVSFSTDKATTEKYESYSNTEELLYDPLLVRALDSLNELKISISEFLTSFLSNFNYNLDQDLNNLYFQTMRIVNYRN